MTSTAQKTKKIEDHTASWSHRSPNKNWGDTARWSHKPHNPKKLREGTEKDVQTQKHTVACTAVSGQRLCKHVPAAKDTNATMEERCFLCGPCSDVISRAVGTMSSVVEYQPAGNDVSTEVEKSPLLRSVTRKRLMKADWEDLVCSDL
jgi:hypothetical protein